MLKYVPEMTSVVMEEIPDMVTLAVDISNCRGNCPGCHSPFLQQDIGEELTSSVIDSLVESNFGVNCFLFLGEGKDLQSLLSLAAHVHSLGLKAALYSGRQTVEEEIWNTFDYVKVGPYVDALGPLNFRTTNQRLYRVHPNGEREDITEIRKPDREDGITQTEMPDKAVKQPEVSDYTIVQTDSSNLSIFPTEVSDTLLQRETASQTHDSLRNTESISEKSVEKTVTKQDYQRMTDKEKAEWIGISLSDMPGSIKRFKSKMEQIGIWHENTMDMTEAFMKLWNQVEKERDVLQNRKDYQRVLRR